MNSISLQHRPRRGEGVLHQNAEGTTVLLCLESGQYFSLDEVGGQVWALCDGSRTVAELAGALAAQYEAPEETIQQDVLALLADLANENLVTTDPAALDQA